MGQQAVGENQLPSGEREVSASLLVSRESPAAAASEPAPFRPQYRPADTEPLRWFSALPPGALRDAQQQFRRAAEICCDIASLKSQLRTLMVRLEEARRRPGSETQSEDARRQAAQLTDAVEALSVK